MINKSILIAALARDCNDSIIRNIPKIELLRKEFKESHVVVIENDSKDGTKETLKRWEKESSCVKIIMNDFGTVTIPQQSETMKSPSTSMHRISKMAKYRNIYMDYARNASFKIDYLIIIDIDIENFSVEGIIKSIKNAPNDWGALFANGFTSFHGFLPNYYDMFAYIDESMKATSPTSSSLYHKKRELNKLLKCNEYINCVSAFGGIGIYKWELIKELYYNAEANNASKVFEAICEHIPFNRNIAENGHRNYICRKMKVKYGNRDFKDLLIYTLIPESIFKTIYFITKRRRFKD